MRRPLFVWRNWSGDWSTWAWVCRGCEAGGDTPIRLMTIHFARAHYRHCAAARAWTAPLERVP